MSDEKNQHIERMQELLKVQSELIPKAYLDPKVCADVLRLNQIMKIRLALLVQTESEHEIGAG